MAPSINTAKFLSTIIIDSLSISRRGYAAAAAQGAAARLGKPTIEEAENAWVPDPVTGYYRPANRANEIDVAELRDMLLKRRFTSSSSH